MKSSGRSLFIVLLLAATQVNAHGPKLMPLQNVPIPPVPGLLDGSDPIVVDKAKAIALGKALFWDTNVGSDGMACGSCHFHAGADSRSKNQLNPGAKGSLPTAQTFEVLPSGTGSGGPNYTVRLSDFPTVQYSNPLCRPIMAAGVVCAPAQPNGALIFSSDDVLASSGTFSGHYQTTSRLLAPSDDCGRATDPVFHVNGTGTRRVEPRNAPTVINAIFNHRNFWDGRANNVFNGSTPWGDRDPNAGVWVKINARAVSKQRLHLINSSLASLATAPPLSDSEMSCQQRSWPDIGRKLLSRQPLQYQKVHNEDSVLGPLSLSTAGALKPGLNTTYRQLVMQAFSPKYWSYMGIGFIPGRTGQAPYNQMEANFAMFFGLALQLYQGTLISDQAPVDLTERDPITHVPTWQGLGYTPEKIQTLLAAQDAFVNNHCNLCHGGPTLSISAIETNAALITPSANTFGPAYAAVPYGPDALGDAQGAYAAGINRYVSVVTRDAIGSSGSAKLIDFGFANTGVANPDTDPGLGGVDDFGHPLSFADQYVQYLIGNYAGVLDPGVKTSRSCDFIQPLTWNVASAFSGIFTSANGIEVDGSREGSPRTDGCINTKFGSPSAIWFIPTVQAAQTSLAADPTKLAVAKNAVFKIPSLRNVELTGPYMHNGGMASLEQVIQFYSRRGNYDNAAKNNLVNQVLLSNTTTGPAARAALIELFKTFTDERVRYERAPFDHPEIAVPNGHPGDQTGVSGGNSLNATLATDDYLVIPAVGANGASQPLVPFDANLAP